MRADRITALVCQVQGIFDRLCRIPIALSLLLMGTLGVSACAQLSSHNPASLIDLPLNQGTIVLDPSDLTHVIAPDDSALFYLQGIAHAESRLFQMDLLRHQAQGRLSELMGKQALEGDIEMRTLGLKEAATRSYYQLSEQNQTLLNAYAEGVNSVIEKRTGLGSLPSLYHTLEISRIKPWTAIDSLAILKLLVTQLSLQIDLESTTRYTNYRIQGKKFNFDGDALFFEDLNRVAPVTRTTTLKGQLQPTDQPTHTAVSPAFFERLKRMLSMPQSVVGQWQDFDILNGKDHSLIGSNFWGVSGKHSNIGTPIIANDPHLTLTFPSIFFEWHLQVVPEAQSADLPMNVIGASLPGLPMVVHGQNRHISWGSTNNPVDHSDLFLDTLTRGHPDCSAKSRLCIYSEGQFHKVVVIEEKYRVNLLGTGKFDDLMTIDVADEFRQRLVVPFRSFGPILKVAEQDFLSLEDRLTQASTDVLTLQYAGLHGTSELTAFITWARAKDLSDFRRGLESFAVGAQNWIYLDQVGNLAYVTGADVPLRVDLESNKKVVQPLNMIREGSGEQNWISDPERQQGQTIPFKVLPRNELPILINPATGILINANNDPTGATLDNNPYNQKRNTTGGIYYLQSEYADGLRAATIEAVLLQSINQDQQISPKDMMQLQGNTTQYDAHLLLPYLLDAYKRSHKVDTPNIIKQFTARHTLKQAINILKKWDYSTPTGIQEGFDQQDQQGNRNKMLTQKEITDSVAATLYNLWRAKMINNTIDRIVHTYDLIVPPHRYALKGLYQLMRQKPFTGVGLSGIDFFSYPATQLLTPQHRLHYVALKSLNDTLESLAGEDFKSVFNNSEDIWTYRWGKLHKATLVDPLQRYLSSDFDLKAPLSNYPSGIPRDGGFEVVNASGFSARASKATDFTFSAGAARRAVAFVRWEGNAQNRVPSSAEGLKKAESQTHFDKQIVTFSSTPGISTENTSLKDASNQNETRTLPLKLWLTGDSRELMIDLSQVKRSTDHAWRIKNYSLQGVNAKASD